MPERLLHAWFQAICTIRSEQQLVEQVDFSLLFRWIRRLVDGRAHVGSPSARTVTGCSIRM